MPDYPKRKIANLQAKARVQTNVLQRQIFMSALHAVPTLYHAGQIAEKHPAHIGGLMQFVFPHNFNDLFPNDL